MNHRGICFAAMLCLLLAPLPALAHKVTVFGWVEGDTVYTESKFSGGKKVNAGKIEIFDAADRLLLEGTTDERGKFDFPLPKGGAALKIVLTAGMGHTNFWQITADEAGGRDAAQNPPSAITSPAVTDPVALDAAAIEAIVERAVEKKLAPIRAQLAQQAWGLRDIVAGLGYILGLMGLASYVHYRKSAQPKGR